jgi:hypothetical protein
LIGHIPVGWFPSKLRVSKDGKKLAVANAKGYGSGPNGGAGFDPGPGGSYVGNLMKGSVTVFDIPSDEKLKELTRQVVQNNVQFATAATPFLTKGKTTRCRFIPEKKKVPSNTSFLYPKKTGLMTRYLVSWKKGTGIPPWPDTDMMHPFPTMGGRCSWTV